MGHHAWGKSDYTLPKFFFQKFSPAVMFIDFRERRREREREKHQCERETSIGCLSQLPQPGIKHAT